MKTTKEFADGGANDLRRTQCLRWLMVVLVAMVAAMVRAQGTANGTQVLAKDSITWNDTISEVKVIGDSIVRYAHKDVVRITKNMRLGSRNTGEMLGKIPGLHYDRFDKSLSYYGDRNIVFLVDSVEKDASYVMRLHHVRFDKVEIIPHPSGQYADYDVVINLHRVPTYEGYENNLTASEQLLPKALDGKVMDATDWSESFTYTKDKWNFNLNYDGCFYQRGQASYGTTRYTQNDYMESIVPNADGSSNSGRYTRKNKVSVAVDRQISKRQSFSVMYQYDNENNDAYANRTSIVSDLAETRRDSVRTRSNDKEKGDIHSLGLYYRNGWKKWNYNLTFNYVNHTWNSFYRVGRSSGYSNIDNRHKRMNHTLTKLDANRALIDYKLYLNAAYTYFWRQYDQYRFSDRAALSKNTLTYHNVWASLSYNLSRSAGMQLSGSATFYQSENGNVKNNYSVFSGGLAFVGKLNNHSFLRLSYRCNASNPRLDQLSTYGYFTDSLNYKIGNPNLKATLMHDAELRYQIYDGWTLTSRLNYAPRNFVNIVESAYGTLQNGREAYYALSTQQNGRNLLWANSLNVEKQLGRFSLSGNVGYSYIRSRYADYKRSTGAWTANGNVSYVLSPSEIYLTFLYKLINSYTVTPQSVGNNRYDFFGLSASKSFCNNNLELSLSYVLPLHFMSLRGHVETATPAYVSSGYNENKYQVNHTVFFSVSYRLQGGKSIRKYKREMSDEK